MQKGKTRDMKKGKPLGHILTFFVPVLLGDLFQQLYNMVDSIIVGRFVSTQALARVSDVYVVRFSNFTAAYQ